MNIDAEGTSKNLLNFWIEIHAGAPDSLHTDGNHNFYSPIFKASAKELVAVILMASTKTQDRIGNVERNHAYLRTVYNTLFAYLSQMRREERLCIMLRARNDTPSANTCLCPATLVYCVYQKLLDGRAKELLMKRADVIGACT